MLLNVSELLNHEGSSIPFETELDLSDLTFGSSCPAARPVKAEGKVTNRAGVYVLEGSVSTLLACTCDRCACSFDRQVSYPMQAVLTADPDTEDQDDFWVFQLVDDQADIDEIARTAFILSMDQQFICRDDCKGLCARCGRNLNLGPCSCRKEADPRFAALAQLLDKKQ